MSDDTIPKADGSPDAFRIVEKYEAFRDYVYIIIENCPREHRVARDEIVRALFAPVRGLYHASQSRQLSRLYEVDAQFATLRSHLRFLVRPKIKVITPHQHEHALVLIAEPGRMLNAWKRKLQSAAGRPGAVGQTGK